MNLMLAGLFLFILLGLIGGRLGKWLPATSIAVAILMTLVYALFPDRYM